MSTEFFNIMEKIERLAKGVKFLDGSHPAIGDKYEKKVLEIKHNLEEVDESLKSDIASFVKATQSPKKTRRIPKSKAIPKP